MKRTLLLTLVLSLALCGSVLAQDEPAAPRGEKAFKAMDTNGDGKVTKEEFLDAAKKRAEARFQKLDVAGKGYITLEDFNTGKVKRGDRAKKGQAKTPE